MSTNQYPNGIPGTLSVGVRNTTPGEPYEIAIMANNVPYCPFVALPCGHDGDAMPELTEANARRIVAAWNACRHLTTEQLEAGDLDYAGCSTLANIRAALGVGEKPMLSELAGIVGTRMGVIKILERDAKEAQVTLARVTKERDEAVEALRRWQELFCDSDMRPEDECHECYDFADAALAKIEGGRNG